jgi:hypothetical protein
MMLVMLGLIVLGSGYLILTLLAAYGAAVLAAAPFPLFGNLAAAAMQLPGADGWRTVFDVGGHVGPVPSAVIAVAVLAVPFFTAGFGIKSRIAYRRELQERRRRDEEIAHDERVRQRERDRLRDEQQRKR